MIQVARASREEYLRRGTVLGRRYEILREVGRGGHSVVYVARDRKLDGEVAIKLLAPAPATARVARERMRREAVAARGLAHPNIVSLHDFREEGAHAYLVMEYVAGPDLKVKVDTGGPLPPARAVRMAIDIAAALHTAHRQGVLHRDVKPQNVLMAPSGAARLTDFGSARLEGQATVTATGQLVGTLAYAAPEELRGERADARSDIYSFGLTLFFALTGRLPAGPSSHLPPAPSVEGYRPRSLRPDVPGWLDEVVARATSEAPARRYPTAGSLRDALRAGSESNGRAGARGLRESEAFYPEFTVGEWCPLCGTTDDLGLGACPGCAGGSGASDTLLFLELPADRGARRAIDGGLRRQLAGATTKAELDDALAGRRALARLPRERAAEAVSRLAARAVPVSAEPRARVWTRVPTGLAATLVAVLVAGLLAGMTGYPLMLVITPLFGLLLFLLAVRRLWTPALRRVRRSRLQLPRNAIPLVRKTLTQLPRGTARSLLQDVVRMVAGVYALSEAPDGPDVSAPLSELLDLSCAVALDVEHLDESLSILERNESSGYDPEESAGPAAERRLQAQARATRARDGLTQKMLEAIAALGRTRIAMAAGDPSVFRLSAATRDLDLQLSAYAEARREVEALTA